MFFYSMFYLDSRVKEEKTSKYVDTGDSNKIQTQPPRTADIPVFLKSALGPNSDFMFDEVLAKQLGLGNDVPEFADNLFVVTRTKSGGELASLRSEFVKNGYEVHLGNGVKGYARHKGESAIIFAPTSPQKLLFVVKV